MEVERELYKTYCLLEKHLFSLANVPWRLYDVVKEFSDQEEKIALDSQIAIHEALIRVSSQCLYYYTISFN